MRPLELLLAAFAAFALAGCATAAQAEEGKGLTANPDSLQWPHWQGRLSFNPLSPVQAPGGNAGLGSTGLGLMSDYYLSGSLFGSSGSGGLRATSGLWVGPSSRAWAGPLLGSQGGGFGADRKVFGPTPAYGPSDGSNDAATIPYLGLGYTGLSTGGGWRFSADMGVMSLRPGSGIKLGRVFTAPQNLDDTVRDMRWSPVFQVGVSYSF